MKAPARLDSFCFISGQNSCGNLARAGLHRSLAFYYYAPRYPVYWQWSFHEFHHDVHHYDSNYYDSNYSYGRGSHHDGFHH